MRLGLTREAAKLYQRPSRRKALSLMTLGNGREEVAGVGDGVLGRDGRVRAIGFARPGVVICVRGGSLLCGVLRPPHFGTSIQFSRGRPPHIMRTPAMLRAAEA
jgi:hypothetical protein